MIRARQFQAAPINNAVVTPPAPVKFPEGIAQAEREEPKATSVELPASSPPLPSEDSTRRVNLVLSLIDGATILHRNYFVEHKAVADYDKALERFHNDFQKAGKPGRPSARLVVCSVNRNEPTSSHNLNEMFELGSTTDVAEVVLAIRAITQDKKFSANHIQYFLKAGRTFSKCGLEFQSFDDFKKQYLLSGGKGSPSVDAHISWCEENNYTPFE